MPEAYLDAQSWTISFLRNYPEKFSQGARVKGARDVPRGMYQEKCGIAH
jgi:hypothetical protein